MTQVKKIVLGHYDQSKLTDLEVLMKECGLEVHASTDGEEVVQLAGEVKPDLVLVDVLMPGINGFEICREIKASCGKRYLAVVLMTDREDAYSRGRARYVSADDIMEHSIDTKKIKKLINTPYQDMDDTGRLLQGKRERHDKFLNTMFRDGAPIRPDGLVARITDPLTGLCNKSYMNLKLEEEFKKSRRYGTPLSLIIVDVDNFEDACQRHGKSAGKEILVNLGSILLCESRDIDIVGRIGDSRFFILLPSTDKDGANIMAERILANIHEHPIDVSEIASGVNVNVSGGISYCPQVNIKTVDDFLNTAIQSLNDARKQGGNRVGIGS